MNRAGIVVLSVVASISLAIGAGQAGAATPSFQGLGRDTFVYEVAGNGSKVAGRDSSGKAAFWTPDLGWTSLGFSGFAYGVSGDGSAITGWSGSSTNSSPNGNSAFLWTQAGGLEWLTNLSGTIANTQALAISADGTTIIGDTISPSGHKESFRWTRDGGMVSLRSDLGDPDATRARGVSGDGSRVVGAYEISFATVSGNWLWQSPGTVYDMTEFPVASTAHVSPWAISADGATSVGGSGAIWREASGLEKLPARPDVTGQVSARDVSGDGSVVTGYAYLSGQQTAVVWRGDGGMEILKDVLQAEYGLDLTGWRLNWAHVSDDGLTFGGRGTDPSGHYAGYVATVPEPGTLALLAAGAMAAGWRVRPGRRRKSSQTH